MKNIINILLLTILTSSYLLSTQIEDEANTSSTLELAIEQDSLALVALYNSTDGDNWNNNTNWLSDSSLSTWYGIRIDKNGRVEDIALESNNLTGRLPNEIGNVDKIRYLILNRNKLSDSIPKEIGKLVDLIYLTLEGNVLSGSIPKELGNLSKLYDLRLNNNKLNGSIPKEIEGLSSLTRLDLYSNSLSGVIPKEIGKLWRLNILDLSFNKLSGSIPKEIGEITNMKNFSLSYNKINGSIPIELFQMKELKSLGLNGNYLVGEVPKEISNLTNLEGLFLFSNRLSGSIPIETGNLNKLKYLSIYDNRFVGSIPNEFGKLARLEHLNLSSNNLSGTIPKELGSMAELKSFECTDNQLEGELPVELGSLTKLENLRISSNRLEGSIPPSFKNLNNLKTLLLNYNEFDGGLENFPSQITSSVWLHFNKFDFGDFSRSNIVANTFLYTPQDSLGEKEIVILEEGEKYTLSSTNEHADGNVYIWFKDGKEVPNETNHDLIISDAQKGDEGIYTCSVTNDIAPLLTLYRRPLTLTFDKTASVNPYVKITDEFKIFPNPAINLVTIEFNNSQSMGSIQILDLLGSEVMSLDFNNQNRINIDVSQFMNGYYNIIITSDDKNYHQSIFINR